MTADGDYRGARVWLWHKADIPITLSDDRFRGKADGMLDKRQ
jgi:hypothetical protein